MATLIHTKSLIPSIPRTSSVVRIVSRAFDAWRSRRALARLDDRALADIGLTRRAALIEANRPVWSVPAVWLG